MASIYEQLHDDNNFYELYRDPTESDFEIAKANGISRKNVKQRMDYGFTIIDAITKPVTRNRKNLDAYEQWEETCKANGIGFKTFERRMKKHGDAKRAATEKIEKPVSKIPAHTKRNVPELYKKWEQQIKANGISFKTFQLRIMRHWDEETAATKKPRTYRGENIK